jgi:hypothetical protein
MQRKTVSLLVLFYVLTGFASAQAASPAAAVIVELTGTVELRPAETAEWIPAAAGMPVEAGTIISTGIRSTALIETGSSRILLRPLTRLSLEEIIRRDGREDIRLFMRTGRIRAEVKPPSGNRTGFTVMSPITVASVRGTSFEFDTVNLRVDEGLIHYSHVNGLTVYVAGGESSYAEEEARRVVPPMEFLAGRRIPRIPQHTGIAETDQSPRFPANAGTTSVGGAGMSLRPGWMP